jgi:hypothetical protein
MNQLVLLAALLATDSSAATPEPRTEVWAAHQVLEGKRRIPIYGEKETHTENFVVAEVQRTGTRIDIRQKLCRVEIRPIKGVSANMKPESVARLPRSRIILDVQPDGTLGATPWSSQWDAEDIDGDGFPGVTVQISGTSCSGDIYVASQSTTTLTGGRATDDGATGEISVHVKQRALGASGLCLRLVAGDSDEVQTGRFAYRRVEPGTSCHALAGKPWPVKAQSSPAK